MIKHNDKTELFDFFAEETIVSVTTDDCHTDYLVHMINYLVSIHISKLEI